MAENMSTMKYEENYKNERSAILDHKKDGDIDWTLRKESKLALIFGHSNNEIDHSCDI